MNFLKVSVLYKLLCMLLLVDGSLAIHNLGKNKRRNEVFIKYMDCLKKTVSYIKSVEFQYNCHAIGLFLMQVNLKWSIIRFGRFLSVTTYNRLEELVDSAGSILKNKSEGFALAKGFNEDNFIESLKPYDFFKEYAVTDLRRSVWPDWEEYKINISRYENHVPAPVLSDLCLTSLSSVRPRNEKCELSEQCKIAVADGTDFGYALTHRILILLMARNGKHCYLFSPKEDSELIEKMCGKLYDEMVFMMRHTPMDIFVGDLVLEMIAFCSMDGYPGFMEGWLNQLIWLQSPSGCFRMGLDQPLSADFCSDHVSSVAVAAFSAGVRYLLQIGTNM